MTEIVGYTHLYMAGGWQSSKSLYPIFSVLYTVELHFRAYCQIIENQSVKKLSDGL